MKTPRILAVLAATALVFGACGSDGDETAVPASGNTANVATQITPSVLPELTPVVDLQPADDREVHVSYAPDVPAPITRTDQRIIDVHLEAVEGVCPVDPGNDVTASVWGYRIAGDDGVVCGTPGPVLRGRVGDLARITLTNSAEAELAHNIDFHAVTGPGGGAAALTVPPGETATIEVRLLYPGAFMYHCAFGDVPTHIAHGMYGMFIVDPEVPLPIVDHEWAVMQSEWYLEAPDASGFAAFDRAGILDENPRFVTFNGRTDALTGDNALGMRTGERARIYMVNEGLSLDSNFHPIGSHWDVVWPEGATHPANDPIRGSQSTLVVAGGGTVVEILGIVPGTILLVDHALGRTFYKGALGQIVVEGDENPEVFAIGTPGVAPVVDEGTEDEPLEPAEEPAPSDDGAEAVTEVTIPEGAFDPANADSAYSPLVVRVPVGATVTWTNDDIVPHTVTSGSSDGRSGSPDGFFDSGDLATGESFSFTFEEAGTFEYHCSPHPWMQGTVVVG